MSEDQSGVLWVVATPIGNLEDVTLRALRVLKEADLVLAEDTRRTRLLLQRHEITTPLRSLHSHTSDARVQRIVQELLDGAALAMVSDAGTPIVSDPGIRLVALARDKDISVIAIPGPSAVLAALTVAGLRCDRFRFVGFIARKGPERVRALDEIARDDDAQVLFESPKRLAQLLADLEGRTGARRVAVCRELTKMHEQVLRGTASELAAQQIDLRGEVTVVIEGRDATEAPSDPDALIREAIAAGRSTKEIARDVAGLTPLSRSEAYARVLACQSEEE